VSILARRLQEEYVGELGRAIEPLVLNEEEALQPAKKQLHLLLDKCAEFVSATQLFEREHIVVASTHSSEDRMRPREVNRRLKAVDRCFINAHGSSAGTSPLKRHALFSLHDGDGYQSAVMASVYRQLGHFIQADKGSEARQAARRQAAREIAMVQMGVQCAINEMQWFV